MTIYVLLEWLSSGKASVYVVPPFDPIAFAELPAEQNDAAIAQRGKVYQAALIIFNLHAQSLDLAGARSKLCEDAYILRAIGHAATALFSTLCGTLRALSIEEQATMRALDGFEYAPHTRKQSVRLLDAENFHKPGVR